nr:olfactory receptor 2W3-like [Odocoileus virginianus texanus]
MDGTNESTQGNFILLGFSDRPHLERILFVVILIAYLLTLVGNTTIILVSRLDPHLHTPMYFFLTHLSFLDLSFTTSSIPQLLYNLNGCDKTISYTGCAIQLFLFLGLGGVECLLLAVMAYDRFVAVCKPLHYMVIMNPRLCLGLVLIAWGCGVANSLIMSPMTLWLPRCGYQKVDHFLCEMPALIRMACVNTAAIEGIAFILAIGIVLSPLVFILISYGCIVRAVLSIQSSSGRHKAFNTCGSHLTVVSLFYGNIIYMYMQPGASSSKDQGKFLTLFYNIVTPLLNPLIYTLRNKEVKGALRRLILVPSEIFQLHLIMKRETCSNRRRDVKFKLPKPVDMIDYIEVELVLHRLDKSHLAVDEGIEQGREDGVEDRDHFVLFSSVIGFGEKIYDDGSSIEENHHNHMGRTS